MVDMYIDNSEPTENVGQIQFSLEYDFQNTTLILKVIQVNFSKKTLPPQDNLNLFLRPKKFVPWILVVPQTPTVVSLFYQIKNIVSRRKSNDELYIRVGMKLSILRDFHFKSSHPE